MAKTSPMDFSNCLTTRVFGFRYAIGCDRTLHYISCRNALNIPRPRRYHYIGAFFKRCIMHRIVNLLINYPRWLPYDSDDLLHGVQLRFCDF